MTYGLESEKCKIGIRFVGQKQKVRNETYAYFEVKLRLLKNKTITNICELNTPAVSICLTPFLFYLSIKIETFIYFETPYIYLRQVLQSGS